MIMKNNFATTVMALAVGLALVTPVQGDHGSTPTPTPTSASTPAPTPAPTPVVEQSNSNNTPSTPVNPKNPAARPTSLSQTAAHLASSIAALRAGFIHAGAGMDKQVAFVEPTADTPSWFQNPYVGADYGFTNIDGTREEDFDTDMHNVSISAGFSTILDLNVGGIFDYSHTNSINDFSSSSETDTFTGSVFASRLITNWAVGGLSLTYSAGHSQSWNPGADGDINPQPDTDTEAYAFSPFVSLFKSWGNWSVSFTPTYSVSLSTSDFNTEDVGNAHATTGTFFAGVRTSYAFTEKLGASLALTPSMLVQQDDPERGNPHADDFWLSVSPSVNYKFTEALNATLGYKYDAFNEDYQSHNISVGLNFNF